MMMMVVAIFCVHLGPINREMRNLISSLKNHNEQLKVEVQRYKRRLREAGTEITKVLKCQIAKLAAELLYCCTIAFNIIHTVRSVYTCRIYMITV